MPTQSHQHGAAPAQAVYTTKRGSRVTFHHRDQNGSVWATLQGPEGETIADGEPMPLDPACKPHQHFAKLVPTPAQAAAMDAEQLRMLADEEQRRVEALERQIEAQRLYC